jgi:Transposase DDE domain
MADRAYGVHHGHAECEDLHHVPAVTQGTDAGKKILGRKRGIITDTLGLLLAVVVTAASVSDNVIGMNLLDQATAAHPTPGPGVLSIRHDSSGSDHAAAQR